MWPKLCACYPDAQFVFCLAFIDDSSLGNWSREDGMLRPFVRRKRISVYSLFGDNTIAIEKLIVDKRNLDTISRDCSNYTAIRSPGRHACLYRGLYSSSVIEMHGHTASHSEGMPLWEAQREVAILMDIASSNLSNEAVSCVRTYNREGSL